MVTGVSFVFGPSTPLLYGFALIFMIIQFWADKFVFVNTARIPDRTDASVATASSLMLAPFVVFRLFMSCWMFSNTSIWQGVNLIDTVLQWVLVNVLGNTDSNLDSATLVSVLSCGTGTFGYIAIRAIMTVPHIFLLCALIIVWMIIERCIAPTMGSCLLGMFPCLQACCSGDDLDEDDNLVTFDELVNDSKLAGAEKFDFKSLEAFQDEVAAELNEHSVKKRIEKDIGERRLSMKGMENDADALDNEDAHFAVVNTKFEVVETSSEEGDDHEQ